MPNAVDTNTFTVSIKDYSRETSSTTVNTVSQTDGAAYTAALSAFQVALLAMVDGERQKTTSQLLTTISSLPSSTVGSSREKKILVSYQDDVTGKAYSFTIPTRDDSAVVFQQNSDFLDLTVEPQLAFVTAAETFVSSPTGNAITITAMKAVGRNL